MNLIDTKSYDNLIFKFFMVMAIMSEGKYKNFSNRLIEALKSNGHVATRSPNGICIPTLSNFAGASEQICRRYIRGDALPDYEKVMNIAQSLNVTPGWLLFGEKENNSSQNLELDDNVLHYILKHSHRLYPVSQGGNSDYADFVLELFNEVRSIDTTESNLLKIIDLAISSISLYEEKHKK